MTAPDLVVQTHGMGVDSVAWLTAVLKGHGPVPSDFDPANLIVVTAMTGREYDATRRAMDEHHLPLLQAHGIRYVQIARAGWSESDGITILSDTGRGDPYRMVMRGQVTLEDWMLRAGTIPQLSNRNCSYWAKGWPLDYWAATVLKNAPRRHVVGFAQEEALTRAVKDEGYSRDVPGKTPWYPLIEWGWDRRKCLSYLWDQYGIEWPRSCCVWCCYQLGDPAGLANRWRAEPDAARDSVAMEANALALNPRASLFGDRTADEVAREIGLADVADEAVAELASRTHALYEVRRIYRRNGDHRHKTTKQWILGPDPYTRATRGGAVWRSLGTIATGTRDEMLAALRAEHGERGGELEVTPRAVRLVLQRPGPPWPSTERYLAVAAAGADKQRGAFESLWQFVCDYQASAPQQGDLMAELAAAS